MTLVGGPVGSAVGTPVVNAGMGYINGLYLTWLTTSTISIANGSCRDSTNQNDIIFGPTLVTTTTPYTTTPSTLVINTAQQGALGVDIGTIAASTLYAVYIIDSSLGGVPVSAVISLSFTQPTLPFGYDSFRRIGAIKTDAGSLVLAFHQEQPGGQPGRRMWYSVPISVLAATASATFVAQNLAAAVPAIKTEVVLQADLLPNAASNFVELRPTDATTGASGANGDVKMSGDVAAVHHFDQLLVCCGLDTNVPPRASIDWITDAASTVALTVTAYVDHL
jgi:hypothetical protein